MAPIIRELQKRNHMARVVFTGQHTDLLEQTAATLGIFPDFNYAVATEADSLAQLAALVLTAVESDCGREQPNYLLVQGDTISAAAGAWSGFLSGVSVVHVEAGLRTGDPRSPYPEEFCRRTIASAAKWHFAPTQLAQANLMSEGIPENFAPVVGNTSIDNLLWAKERLPRDKAWRTPTGLKVLVTLHRRENQQGKISEILCAVQAACQDSNATALIPQHPSPSVRAEIERVAGRCDLLKVIPSADYLTFVSLMSEADVIVTDSGGVQEEAPALGTPVLVARESTERPEAVAAGCARLVGTSHELVYSELSRLLSDNALRLSMVVGGSPFGDGRASPRIVDCLESDFQS